MQSKTLAHVLWSATDSERLQWYFNGLRYRRAMAPHRLALLGSGTSPNESLHSEINRWFGNQPELYVHTLQIQLRINTIAKLMTHNSALYSPTLRQLDQQTVLATASGKWRFPDEVWTLWCGQNVDESDIAQKADLPKLRFYFHSNQHHLIIFNTMKFNPFPLHQSN